MWVFQVPGSSPRMPGSGSDISAAGSVSGFSFSVLGSELQEGSGFEEPGSGLCGSGSEGPML